MGAPVSHPQGMGKGNTLLAKGESIWSFIFLQENQLPLFEKKSQRVVLIV
jgi:hypothetical protein